MTCGSMRGALMSTVKSMRREWSCYPFSQSIKLNCLQYMVQEERYRQADLATSKVQEVALH